MSEGNLVEAVPGLCCRQCRSSNAPNIHRPWTTRVRLRFLLLSTSNAVWLPKYLTHNKIMYLFLLAVIMDRKSQLRAERGSMVVDFVLVVAMQPLRGSTLGWCP